MVENRERQQQRKCFEALQHLYGVDFSAFKVCLHHRGSGLHNCKVSLYLAVSCLQLPGCFICPCPWEIPSPMKRMYKKPGSLPLSSSRKAGSDAQLLCCTLSIRRRKSFYITCESARWSPWWSAPEDPDWCSPWLVFFSGIMSGWRK